MTPTARSIKLLRAEGYLVATVERWLPHANLRSDCFGFGDLLACQPRDRAIVLVQTTTLPHLPARIAKAKALAALEAWLRAGGRVEFHGWTHRAGRWQCKRVSINAADLVDVVLCAPRRRRHSRYRQLELWD